MHSSKKPLLVILFSVLCLMLWQAWRVDTQPPTLDTAQRPGKLHRLSRLPALIKDDEVTVKTDKILFKINKRGATITSVGLLDFPNALNNPEPFTLFHVLPKHQYTAHSGFEGEEKLVFDASESLYRMQDGKNTLTVAMRATTPNGLVYQKFFVFTRGSYEVKVLSEIQNQGNAPHKTGAHVSRFQLTQDFSSQEKKPEFTIDPDQPKPGWFTFSTFTGPSFFTNESPFNKLPFRDAIATPLMQQVKGTNWIAMQQRYFLAAWVNQDDATIHKVRTRSQSETGEEVLRKRFSFENVKLPETLAPKAKTRQTALLYAGPEEANRLAPLAKGLELTVDYGWLWFLSSILFDVMTFLQRYLSNWGATIIVTTVLIKLVFYKMSEASFKTMAQQRKLKPKIDEIQAKYKDQPEKKQQAIMDLYQKESINPLRSGCLPSLLPLPFFIALYYVLIESVQLRHASFLWIPDLSSYDPWYILPVLMGLTMVMQQKLSPPQEDPAQEKAMMLMPLMMTMMFAQFPAGLVLYSVTNQLLSNIQQYFIMRSYGSFQTQT